jgi:ATP-dependent helicase/nuclease subunit B
MADRRRPTVFSIPTDRAFADALVEGLIAQFGANQMTLARGIILVPNNRAGTAIQDAFVRQSEKGLLLPRLIAIGDADIGERMASALDPIDAEPIPPAVEPLHRQLILAGLLQKSDASLDGAQAMRLAADLGRVLDQLTAERKSLHDLPDNFAMDLQDHWQNALAQLDVVLKVWPLELNRLGRIDLADRRNQQLDRVAEQWRSAPPSGFVIAAGISIGAPTVAALLKTVAQMERGQVVLAGLDHFMPPEEWDFIAGDDQNPPLETHPQFHLRHLLDGMGVPRALVEPWRWGRTEKVRVTRAERVSLAMAPAAFTHKWVGLKRSERTLTGISALELATPAEEAQTIALALREAIETRERSAALVTPDRALAERVSAHLKRWGIAADDSAGRPLSASQPGTLLLALANGAAESFAPVPLLTLLKHPLVQAGEGRLTWLDGVRTLDLALRGPRAAVGLAGVDALLAHQDERTQKLKSEAALWWQGARALLEPLEASGHGSPSFAEMLAALRSAAESLAGEALWAGQEGRAAADLIAELEAHANDTALGVTREAMPKLLRDLMDGIAIRPAQGGHPRLFIWGLLEAKLQSADVMILAGLNESVWPQLTSPDPWLAPAVRRALKLPSLERRIGLSAHDLASALGARSVLLTRAKRDGTAPTIASRFWLRLETLTEGLDPPTVRYDLLAQQLDYGKGERATRPMPAPPQGDRPKVISVTAVDTLKADPYSFYAKTMLKLTALSAPGEEPDAKWRGTFLHDVLGEWGQKDHFAKGLLLPRLLKAFDESGLHPVVRAMWQPRFEEAIQWFEDRVEAGRLEGREPIKAEIDGEFNFLGVRLKGRADRIDQLPNGELAIVDYKTGSPPSSKQVMQGYALQLGLIAHLAQCGGFPGVKGVPTLFEYWSQARESGKPYGYVKSPNVANRKQLKEPSEFVAHMYEQFETAIDDWLLGERAFRAKDMPDYAWSDYDQLMRYDEWQGHGG